MTAPAGFPELDELQPRRAGQPVVAAPLAPPGFPSLDDLTVAPAPTPAPAAASPQQGGPPVLPVPTGTVDLSQPGALVSPGALLRPEAVPGPVSAPAVPPPAGAAPPGLRTPAPKPAPKPTPFQIPKVAAAKLPRTAAEMEYYQAREDRKNLPAFARAPGRRAAEYGPVQEIEERERMALGRFATEEYPKVVADLQARFARLGREREAIQADLTAGKKVPKGRLAAFEAERRGLEARNTESQALYTRWHDEANRQFMDASGRTYRARNVPMHPGLRYADEPERAQGLFERAAGFFAQKTLGATQTMPAMRAALQWEGRYDPPPTIPYKGPEGRQRGFRERQQVQDALVVFGPRLRDDGTVDTPRLTMMTPERRRLVQNLTPWQKSIIAGERRRLGAEREAVEMAGIKQAFAQDLAALGFAEMGAGAVRWLINNPATREVVKRTAPRLFVRYVQAVAPRIAEELGPPLSREALNRLVLRTVPRVAIEATVGGGAAATGAAGTTLMAGGTPEEAARAGAAAFVPGAVFAGGISATLATVGATLRSGWHPERTPRLIEGLVEEFRRRGASEAEVALFNKRLTAYAQATPIKKAGLWSMLEKDVRAVSAKRVGRPQPGAKPPTPGAREAPKAPRPRPPAAPEPTAAPARGPRVTMAGGAEIALRETPRQVLGRHAQSPEPVVAQAARDWLGQHEAYDVQMQAPLPDDPAVQQRYVKEWLKSPEKAQADLIRASAQKVVQSEPEVAQRLTAAAAEIRNGFQYNFVSTHNPESVVPPSVKPPEVSPWRQLTLEDRAALPGPVRRALLIQDVSNSTRVIAPEAPPFHNTEAIEGVKNEKALTQYADELFDSAQRVLEEEYRTPVVTAAEEPTAVAPQPAAPPAPVSPQPAEAPTAVALPPAAPAPPVSPQPAAETLTAAAPKREPSKPLWQMTQGEFIGEQRRASWEKPLEPTMLNVARSGAPGFNVEHQVHIALPDQPERPIANDLAVVYRSTDGTPLGALKFEVDASGQVVSAPQVFVDPSVRRQGIASKLYDLAEEKGYDFSGLKGRTFTEEGARLFHARAIKRAVEEGKSVPAEVLADYPKLRKPEAPELAPAPIEPKAERPIPTAAAPGAPSTESARKVENMLGAWAKKLALENFGEGVLNEIEERGLSPQAISETFWDKTYWKLDGKSQARFHRYLDKLVGIKPGEPLWTKDGETHLAEHWPEIAETVDLGADPERLEGIERGYVVLMHLANKELGETSEPPVKALAKAAVAPEEAAEAPTYGGAGGTEAEARAEVAEKPKAKEAAPAAPKAAKAPKKPPAPLTEETPITPTRLKPGVRVRSTRTGSVWEITGPVVTDAQNYKRVPAKLISTPSAQEAAPRGYRIYQAEYSNVGGTKELLVNEIRREMKFVPEGAIGEGDLKPGVHVGGKHMGGEGVLVRRTTRDGEKGWIVRIVDPGKTDLKVGDETFARTAAILKTGLKAAPAEVEEVAPAVPKAAKVVPTGVQAVAREAERLEKYHLAHRAPSGQVGVGSEGVPEGLVAEALRTFLREEHKGKSVAEARQIAGNDLREAIQKHNAKRPKDFNWGRSAEHGQDKLDWAAQRLAVVTEAAPSEAPAKPTVGVEARKEPWQMTRAELLGVKPAVSLEARGWNEEEFFASRPTFENVSEPIHKARGPGGGYEFAVAEDATTPDRMLLVARSLGPTGEPVQGELGQWAPVGEYEHGNLGIADAYRGKGAGTAFVKHLMQTGVIAKPVLGYSPEGLKTFERAHREIVAEATAQGKNVPAPVRADYPDLQKAPEAPAYTGGERRQDVARRKRVEEMTPEERAAATKVLAAKAAPSDVKRAEEMLKPYAGASRAYFSHERSNTPDRVRYFARGIGQALGSTDLDEASVNRALTGAYSSTYVAAVQARPIVDAKVYVEWIREGFREMRAAEEGRKGGEVQEERPLPPAPLLPEKGTYPAIQTDDGAVYPDTRRKPSTHVQFIREMGIPAERVVGGGWVTDGVYNDAEARSHAAAYGEQARAKLRVVQRRTSRQDLQLRNQDAAAQAEMGRKGGAAGTPPALPPAGGGPPAVPPALPPPPPPPRKPRFPGDTGDEKAEGWLRRTKTAPQESDLEKFRDGMQRAYNWFTRAHEHLPPGPEFSDVKEQLTRAAQATDLSAGKTMRVQQWYYEMLNPRDQEHARRVAVFRDMKAEIATQRKRHLDAGGEDADFQPLLPSGITEEEATQWATTVEDQLVESPRRVQIEEALQRRLEGNRKILDDMFDAMEPVTGKRPELTREDWLHHAIIHYMEGRHAAAGKPGKLPGKLGALQRRRGSPHDYITGLIEAEADWMPQAIRNKMKYQFIQTLENNHDITRDLYWNAMVANDETLAKAWDDLAGGRMSEADIETLANTKLSALAADEMLPDNISRRWADLIGELEERDRLAKVQTEQGQPVNPGPLSEEAREALQEYALWLTKTRVLPGAPEAEIRRNPERAKQLKKAAAKEKVRPEDLLALPDYEGYDGWSPRKGYSFDVARPIQDHFADHLLDEFGKASKVETGKARKALGPVGMVLPRVLAQTLDGMDRPDLGSFDDYVRRGQNRVMQTWKFFRLFVPPNSAIYFAGNARGDIHRAYQGGFPILRPIRLVDEIRVTGLPAGTAGEVPALPPRGGVAATVKRKAKAGYLDLALRELGPVLKTGAWGSPELEAWLDLGGITSLFEAHETGVFAGTRPLEKFGRVPSPARRLYRGTLAALQFPHHYREASVRYAVFRMSLDDIQKHGRPTKFGGALRDEVLALPDAYQQAFVISRETMGGYDTVSEGARWIANHVAPFFRYQWINARTQKRFLMNALQDPNITDPLGRRFTGARKGAAITRQVGRWVAVALFLEAASSIANYTLFPEEESELPEYVRWRPHLIMGRNEDSSVRYVDALGNLVDLLSWFNLDNTFGYGESYLNGRMTKGEIAKDMGKEFLNRIYQQIGPQYKLPIEGIGGITTFPDVFKPVPMKDRWEWVFDQINAGSLYRWYASRPQKRGLAFRAALGVKSVDTGQGVYMDMKRYAHEFLLKEDPAAVRNLQIRGDTPRSNALWLWREADRLGDTETALQRLYEYGQANGTPEGFADAMKRSEPLHDLNSLQEEKLLQEMAPADRVRMRTAYTWWQQDVVPGSVPSTARKLEEFISETRRDVERSLIQDNPMQQMLREQPELQQQLLEEEQRRAQMPPKR
mgnify:CR=1 FL=1